MLKDLVVHIAQRFKEPSSWAGITGIVAMAGFQLSGGVAQDISFIGAGICGLIAFFVPEDK